LNRGPIDHVNWRRLPRKTRGQLFVQFRRQHDGLRSAEVALGHFTPFTSSSLRSERVLSYGGHQPAETGRFSQLEQVPDERCRRWGDHRRRGHGPLSRTRCGAGQADLGSGQLPSLYVGETEQSDSPDDEVPTFRDSIDAEEWISRWGFQSTPGPSASCGTATRYQCLVQTKWPCYCARPR
jgi:hypothetical protein